MLHMFSLFVPLGTANIVNILINLILVLSIIISVIIIAVISVLISSIQIENKKTLKTLRERLRLLPAASL